LTMSAGAFFTYWILVFATTMVSQVLRDRFKYLLTFHSV
jgi:hypothetical protein